MVRTTANLVERRTSLPQNGFRVTIVSLNAATDSQVEAIRNHRNSGKRGISFGFANDAYVVRCESATSTYEGGARKWMVNLVKEDIQYGGGFSEMAYSNGNRHFSAEDFVHMRAERILLAKTKQPAAQRGSSFDVSGSMIESFIQGSNTPIKVTSSPIVELAGKMSRTDGVQFLRCARLVTLFYLKAGDVVERIEHLTLGPMQKNSVHVEFRGVRRRKYANMDPEVITVEGDCPLP